MLERVEANLSKLQFSPKQEYFWTEVRRIFNWCDSFLPRSHRRLDDRVLEQLDVGHVPQCLLERLRDDLVRELKETLSWSAHGAIVRQALKTRSDISAWMNCPPGDHHKLPKRIRDAVAKAEQQHRDSLADACVKVSDKELIDYVHVWRSHELASSTLGSLAAGLLTIGDLDSKANQSGQVHRGRLRLDERRYALRSVATYGGLQGRGIARIVFNFAQRNDCQFFVKLGRTLEKAAQQRQPEVDWDRVNEVERFLVAYWCGHWGQALPPLCLFENGALATVCALALGRRQSDKSVSIDAIRKHVSRLRLKRARTPKIGQVFETQGGTIEFRRH